MSHCLPDGAHLFLGHTPAIVPDHYGTDGRVAEASAVEAQERRARATMVIAEVTPAKLPTQVVVPRSIRRAQGA